MEYVRLVSSSYKTYKGERERGEKKRKKQRERLF